MDFNQANLDHRLADLSELAGRLSPEQTEQVRERVRERVSSSGSSIDAAGVDAALEMLFALPRGVGKLPELLGWMKDAAGGAGRSVGDALSAVNPFGRGGAAGGDQSGAVVDSAGAILGQMAELLGSVSARGGDVLSAAGSLGGDALSAAGSAAGAAGEVAGVAGEAAGAILGAIGDVLGSLN